MRRAALVHGIHGLDVLTSELQEKGFCQARWAVISGPRRRGRVQYRMEKAQMLSHTEAGLASLR